MNDEGNKIVFAAYSDYYDLLYSDKDYPAESEYVLDVLKNYCPAVKSVADLGCGTGRHAIEFARKGLNVTGIEISDSMLEMARNNVRASGLSDKIFLEKGDITELNVGRKFDAVAALFHVIGYVNQNEKLLEAFRRISALLDRGGVFVFDYWYGPAVLSMLPENRVKKITGSTFDIERRTTPKMSVNRNLVQVNFDVSVLDKTGNEIESFSEVHSMRYFFLPELELLLNLTGFELIRAEEWMSGKEPGNDTWSCICIAGRK